MIGRLGLVVNSLGAGGTLVLRRIMPAASSAAGPEPIPARGRVERITSNWLRTGQLPGGP
jgi:hypothetical protein